jgi:hypothetical protein
MKKLLFMCLIVMPWLGQAQILNIEKSRLNNDSTEHLLGNVAARFSMQKRTVLVFSGQLNTNFNYNTKNHSFIGIGTWHLVKSETADLISDGYAHLRANWLREKVLSYESFAQAQYDAIRGMNHRYLLGANMRFRFGHTDKRTFLLALGGMMEWEEWLSEGVVFPSNYFKINSYFMWQQQLTPSLDFNIGGYYQARPKLFFSPRITGDAYLNIKVTSKLSFNTRFSMIYDAIPVIPIDKLVYSWQNGVAYNF